VIINEKFLNKIHVIGGPFDFFLIKFCKNRRAKNEVEESAEREHIYLISV